MILPAITQRLFRLQSLRGTPTIPLLGRKNSSKFPPPTCSADFDPRTSSVGTGGVHSACSRGPAAASAASPPIHVDWLLTDNLGTIRDVAGYDDQADTTTVAAHYTFGAFGNVTSGDTGLTRYLFTGQEYDAELGLYYYDQRWYDPQTGQFVSLDPMEDDQENTYRYVENNLTNAVDPTGLDLIWLVNNESGFGKGHSGFLISVTQPVTLRGKVGEYRWRYFSWDGEWPASGQTLPIQFTTLTLAEQFVKNEGYDWFIHYHTSSAKDKGGLAQALKIPAPDQRGFAPITFNCNYYFCGVAEAMGVDLKRNRDDGSDANLRLHTQQFFRENAVQSLRHSFSIGDLDEPHTRPLTADERRNWLQLEAAGDPRIADHAQAEREWEATIRDALDEYRQTFPDRVDQAELDPILHNIALLQSLLQQELPAIRAQAKAQSEHRLSPRRHLESPLPADPTPMQLHDFYNNNPHLLKQPQASIGPFQDPNMYDE